MAKWQITQTQQVGNTTINTWQNVPSLADIMAEARREEEKRLTKRALDFAEECAYETPCKQCIHPSCKNFANRQSQ